MSAPKVRPTTAKVRESLMAILAAELDGARVLDLFAGSGSLGLASLQEGAAEVVFVEGDPKVAQQLRPRLTPACRLVTGKLPQALGRLKGRFDVILADPPYDAPQGPRCLQGLDDLMNEGAVAVFEHHHKQDYPDTVGGLELYRRERHGETALSFYRQSAKE
ncbi:MAG: RsmD family RNA methyltransferase [Candidatus Eremiobacteraeota bacterium]|nr:RsmD family RNA methyltransferase [Candidatus Eremiobacteraeota bacterium]